MPREQDAKFRAKDRAKIGPCCPPPVGMPVGVSTPGASEWAGETVEADCYIAARDWDVLLAKLNQESWMNLDCLRRACRARAYKDLGSASSAKAEWIAAMEASENRLDLLVELLNAGDKRIGERVGVTLRRW